MTDVLKARFRLPANGAPSDVDHLNRRRIFLSEISSHDPFLRPAEWLIATGERSSSQLYPVFDSTGPAKAALAVFSEDFKKSTAAKSFALWNGQENRAQAANIMSVFERKDGASDLLQLSVRAAPGTSRFTSWDKAIEVLKALVRAYSPLVASMDTPNYEGVFKDKVGVGWMLYLPRALAAQQVPEARALVPVKSKDYKGKEQQIGTIVVSVTDSPFSDENPEHVKTAHAIEIRLVDQDLLPRYADL